VASKAWTVIPAVAHDFSLVQLIALWLWILFCIFYNLILTQNRLIILLQRVFLVLRLLGDAWGFLFIVVDDVRSTGACTLR
jgi:hypothetical protein